MCNIAPHKARDRTIGNIYTQITACHLSTNTFPTEARHCHSFSKLLAELTIGPATKPGSFQISTARAYHETNARYVTATTPSAHSYILLNPNPMTSPPLHYSAAINASISATATA
jgi:hypothetical protein